MSINPCPAIKVIIRALTGYPPQLKLAAVADQGFLRQVEYTDADGRKSLRLIPRDAPDEDAAFGILVGPPPLTGLGLPLELEVRLSNELYARGLLTERDLRKRRQDGAAAMMAACRLDIDRIIGALQ